jgi:hypothetical protein
MANVIDEEAIAIAPFRHVKVAGGRPVVMPERLVQEEVTKAGIVGEAETVADHKEAERLPESGLPVKFLAGNVSWAGQA